MRIAALVLGIIGGVAGLVGAVFMALVGRLGLLAGEIARQMGPLMGPLPGEAETFLGGAGTTLFQGFMAMLLAVLGLAGAGLVLSKPKTAAWCMGISAVGGLLAIAEGYIVAALCLGAATGIALADIAGLEERLP